MSNGKRWLATVFYRADAGLIDVCHDIEELDELAEIVERGPDWNAIDKIEVILHRVSHPGLTIEGAKEL